MRLKYWQVFLIGLGIVFVSSTILLTPEDVGRLLADYVIIGGIATVAYYIIFVRPRKKLESKV